MSRSSAPKGSTEIRRQLEDTERRLQLHLRSLRSELNLRDVNVGQSPILDYVRWNPFVSVGLVGGVAALLALTVSLLRRESAEIDEQEQWMRAMIDDLLDDAAARVGPDTDGDKALRRALRKRSPVIFIESTHPRRAGEDKPSLVRTVAKAALGFGGKAALNYLTRELTSREGGAHGAAPHHR